MIVVWVYGLYRHIKEFVIRYSLFVIRYSLFVIRYSLFVIRYSLFVIRYLSVNRSRPIINYSLSIIN
ncbi:MAG: hypothetical protein EOO49_12960 [Flavobacterium sp.]|nr:MAG: hypothetical protein EOO49_12960 [Flavobacterium sp.]